MKASTALKHVDCFSGVGGICTGFVAAGIKTVLAIEKVKSCVETYKANHSSVPIIHGDIREVSEKKLRKKIDGPVDILTAGMPCETFSTAGSKSRSFYDHRQFLFSDGIRIATILKARIILFENVPAITTKTTCKGNSRLVIDELYDELTKHGYKYNISVILNSVDFGIPQVRKRLFILATNEESIRLITPIGCHNGKVAVKDAFVGLPKITANSEQCPKKYLKKDSDYTRLLKDKEFWRIDKNDEHGLTYHIPPKHRETTLKRFALIEPGEGLRDLFKKFSQKEIERLQEQRILPKKWYIQRNRRLVPNEPSVTVTSHCLDEMIHPKLNRALTVREVARLQSFPDAYDFKGGPFICPHIYETQDKYEQIGDAVPPLLAYEWAKVIKEILGGQ